MESGSSRFERLELSWYQLFFCRCFVSRGVLHQKRGKRNGTGGSRNDPDNNQPTGFPLRGPKPAVQSLIPYRTSKKHPTDGFPWEIPKQVIPKTRKECHPLSHQQEKPSNGFFGNLKTVYSHPWKEGAISHRSHVPQQLLDG